MAVDVGLGFHFATDERDFVALEFRVQRGGLDPQKPRRSHLISVGPLQSRADKIDFKSLHFVTEFDAALAAAWSSALERFQFLQERQDNFSQRLDPIVERRFLQMNHRGNAVGCWLPLRSPVHCAAHLFLASYFPSSSRKNATARSSPVCPSIWIATLRTCIFGWLRAVRIRIGMASSLGRRLIAMTAAF